MFISTAGDLLEEEETSLKEMIDSSLIMTNLMKNCPVLTFITAVDVVVINVIMLVFLYKKTIVASFMGSN